MNSVLQCLRNTRELTSQISSTSQECQLINTDKGFGIATKLRLFLTTSDETSMIAALKQLREKLGKYDKKFNGVTMQCASELCDTMLTAMFAAHCESSPAELVRYTATTAMKCRSCKIEWEGASEEGTVLYVALAENRSLQTSIDVCLQPELLEEVRCENCAKCRVERQWSFHTAPLLIISLKLNYSENGAKLLSTVRNEDTVNVGQHQYKIFAVVSHIGRQRERGHYIAYVETKENWNCFNDSTVTRNKHWRSELEHHETPCMFFLRKIPGEECSQFSQQHKTSPEKEEGQIENTPSVTSNMENVSKLKAHILPQIPRNQYCIQMTHKGGEDSFEGFCDRNGKRDGKGRYTWADSAIGLMVAVTVSMLNAKREKKQRYKRSKT